jgi:hypothetical protein
MKIHPFAGMFSFLPCVADECTREGFAHPTISIPGVFTPSMTQNKRLNPRQDLEEVQLLRLEVVDQVTEQGLFLGVQADLPKELPPQTT